jgi:hypothetical protein
MIDKLQFSARSSGGRDVISPRIISAVGSTAPKSRKNLITVWVGWHQVGDQRRHDRSGCANELGEAAADGVVVARDLDIAEAVDGKGPRAILAATGKGELAIPAGRTQPQVAMTALPSNISGMPFDGGLARLMTCFVDQLHTHPSLVQLGIVPSDNDLSTAIRR